MSHDYQDCGVERITMVILLEAGMEDRDALYFDDNEDTPDCFGDWQPGTYCDFCPYEEECR